MSPIASAGSPAPAVLGFHGSGGRQGPGGGALPQPGGALSRLVGKAGNGFTGPSVFESVVNPTVWNHMATIKLADLFKEEYTRKSEHHFFHRREALGITVSPKYITDANSRGREESFGSLEAPGLEWKWLSFMQKQNGCSVNDFHS